MCFWVLCVFDIIYILYVYMYCGKGFLGEGSKGERAGSEGGGSKGGREQGAESRDPPPPSHPLQICHNYHEFNIVGCNLFKFKGA